jgi:hypothetical protein
VFIATVREKKSSQCFLLRSHRCQDNGNVSIQLAAEALEWSLLQLVHL